ncbi:hypothetical protein Scel_76750 [Streptomyces cellostaticus]|nr:hypothetical protein Scel_76750 [Streptomyces cellostaticus]
MLRILDARTGDPVAAAPARRGLTRIEAYASGLDLTALRVLLTADLLVRALELGGTPVWTILTAPRRHAELRTAATTLAIRPFEDGRDLASGLGEAQVIHVVAENTENPPAEGPLLAVAPAIWTAAEPQDTTTPTEPGPAPDTAGAVPDGGRLGESGRWSGSGPDTTAGASPRSGSRGTGPDGSATTPDMPSPSSAGAAPEGHLPGGGLPSTSAAGAGGGSGAGPAAGERSESAGEVGMESTGGSGAGAEAGSTGESGLALDEGAPGESGAASGVPPRSAPAGRATPAPGPVPRDTGAPGVRPADAPAPGEALAAASREGLAPVPGEPPVPRPPGEHPPLDLPALLSDPASLRLALLSVPRNTAVRLDAGRLEEAARTLAHWRRAVAGWARQPSRPVPDEVRARLRAAWEDDLDLPGVLDVLRDVERAPGLPDGARFETYVYADRLLAVDLARDLGSLA